jgi:hypothetical protein
VVEKVVPELFMSKTSKGFIQPRQNYSSRLQIKSKEQNNSKITMNSTNKFSLWAHTLHQEDMIYT